MGFPLRWVQRVLAKPARGGLSGDREGKLRGERQPKTHMEIYRTITEQVAAHLRQDILSGRLKAGQPLREQALSERFGVSRGPIREVFAMLADQGLLVKEPNKGVQVASRPMADVRPLVVDLRKRIETYVLDQVFDRITPRDLQSLDSVLQDMESACRREDPDALMEQDIRFHQTLVGMHPSPDLLRIWEPIMTRMLLEYTRHGDLMESYLEHKRIADAIREGNQEAALEALAANIL